MFNESVFIVMGATALVAAYFAPTARAILNGYPHILSILVLNILLGWTLVGWFLLMTRVARHRPSEGSEPTLPSGQSVSETSAIPTRPTIVAAPLPPEEERDDYAAWLKRNRNRW